MQKASGPKTFLFASFKYQSILRVHRDSEEECYGTRTQLQQAT